MARLWSHLRGHVPEQRLSVDDWASMFNYGGVTYPITNTSPTSGTEAPGSDYLGMVNQAYKGSGAVFACCLARQLIFTEMRFQYQKMATGRPGDLFGTQGLSILENPWPNGTTGELCARALQDTDFAGNHYIVHEGDRLRRLRPDWVEIMLSAPPSEAVASDVTGYIYKPGNTPNPELWQVYPVDGSQGAIAHWSPIPDPDAQYRGMSWLTPLIREIQADRAAMTHKQRFFENGASPQLAVSFKESVTAEQFKTFVRQMEAKKVGLDHAYETLYLGGGADVTVVGKDLRQMDFRVTQNHGETRIAAAARVPSSIVGFSEGTQVEWRNEGGFNAVREHFGSGTLRPLWRSLCAAYSVLVPTLTAARLWYDDRDIAYLRRDQAEQADLQATQADTVSRYIMNGFTPESAIAAVIEGDIRLLEHTGLFSVQLQPPMPDGVPDATDPGPPQAPAQPTNGKKPEPSTKGQAK